MSETKNIYQRFTLPDCDNPANPVFPVERSIVFEGKLTPDDYRALTFAAEKDETWRGYAITCIDARPDQTGTNITVKAKAE